MERLVEKDPNLKYKFEQKGRSINYLDLNLKIEEGKVKIDIFRNETHVWDIPEWKSRTNIKHRKAAILPLLIRAHRVLKNYKTRVLK